MTVVSENLKSVLSRGVVFVHGKGGVGKTVVSQAIAHRLAQSGQKTLWVTLEDPLLPAGECRSLAPSLWHLNCDFSQAFEEYAALKIGVAPLTRLFLQNKLIRYLAKAAPGIHELVLLGKIWHERVHYSHVVVDLPSTGHGLAMFQCTENFVKLFQGGPLHRDALSMLRSFEDPEETGHLILALPEEMPLREALDLNSYLNIIFPRNPSAFLVNRLFPTETETETETSPTTPLARSAKEYSDRRRQLEAHNLRLWRDEGIPFGNLSYVPPPLRETPEAIVKKLTKQLQERGYV